MLSPAGELKSRTRGLIWPRALRTRPPNPLFLRLETARKSTAPERRAFTAPRATRLFGAPPLRPTHDV